MVGELIELRQPWRTVEQVELATARWVDYGAMHLVLLFALTALDVGGQVTLWKNAHWTLAGALDFGLAMRGARRATGDERRLRTIAAGSLGLRLIGQLVWNVQVAVGYVTLSAPSDLLFLGSFVPDPRRAGPDHPASRLTGRLVRRRPRRVIVFAGTVAMIGVVIGLGSPADPELRPHDRL